MTPTAVLDTAALNRLWTIVGRFGWKSWIGLAGLGAISGLVEAVGASLVLLLIALAISPAQVESWPLVAEIGDTPEQRILIFCSVVAVFFALRFLLLLGQAFAQNRIVNNMAVKLSEGLLKRYLAITYADYQTRNSAEMIRNVTDSVDVVTRIVLLSVVQLTSELLIVLGVCVVLMVAAPLPTLAVGGILMISVVAILALTRSRLARLGKTQQSSYRDALQSLQQTFQNFREIRLLGKEDFFLRDFVLHRSEHAHAYDMQATLQTLPRLVLELLFALVLVAFLAIRREEGGALREVIPLVGLFGYTLLRVMPALNRVMFHLNNIQWGSAAIGSVFDGLRHEPDGAPIQKVDALHLGSGIELRDVSFTYPGIAEPALKNVSLRIAPGEFVGVAGPTGAGKSTLADVIMGLLPPTDGAILVDGRPLESEPREWFSSLGVVPQESYLVDDSIRRNVALGENDDEVDPVRLTRALEVAQLSDFVETLPDGLDSVVGERGTKLSGGQRQRIAIARAVYREPEVLIFDEGTSALDNITEAAMMRALTALRGKTTLIVIAHRLTTIRECDRLMILESGSVTDTGSFDTLAERNDLLRQMLLHRTSRSD
jgi:ATP-binding cassette subfamily C protein